MDPLIQLLEPFLGDWTLEATFPGAPPTGPAGHATFEWMLNGRFLAERTTVESATAPDGFCLIAVKEDGGYTQHYFDERGVVRIYEMTFADGLWTLERRQADFSELSFHQRYEGRFSDDGRTIEGRWETSPDGVGWEVDFELTYRRV